MLMHDFDAAGCLRYVCSRCRVVARRCRESSVQQTTCPAKLARKVRLEFTAAALWHLLVASSGWTRDMACLAELFPCRRRRRKCCPRLLPEWLGHFRLSLDAMGEGPCMKAHARYPQVGHIVTHSMSGRWQGVPRWGRWRGFLGPRAWLPLTRRGSGARAPARGPRPGSGVNWRCECGTATAGGGPHAGRPVPAAVGVRPEGAWVRTHWLGRGPWAW